MATLRAKLAVKKIMENNGKTSVSAAMKAVGFSPTYAKNPQLFIKTAGVKDLIEEYLPDDLVGKVHNELLGASEIQHYTFPKLVGNETVEEIQEPQPQGGSLKRKKKKIKKKIELTNDEIKSIVESVPGCKLIYIKRDMWGAHAYFQAPDHKSRRDAVDMAYKRKGNYAPEQIELTKRKYQGLSNADLAALEKRLKDKLLKK